MYFTPTRALWENGTAKDFSLQRSPLPLALFSNILIFLHSPDFLSAPSVVLILLTLPPPLCGAVSSVQKPEGFLFHPTILLLYFCRDSCTQWRLFQPHLPVDLTAPCDTWGLPSVTHSVGGWALPSEWDHWYYHVHGSHTVEAFNHFNNCSNCSKSLFFDVVYSMWHTMTTLINKDKKNI